MAKKLGVAEWLYAEYETGRRGVPAELRPGEIVLTDVEKCVVMRRRRNMTQQEMADVLECSRLWVIRMENGRANPARLLSHWLG